MKISMQYYNLCHPPWYARHLAVWNDIAFQQDDLLVWKSKLKRQFNDLLEGLLWWIWRL